MKDYLIVADTKAVWDDFAASEGWVDAEGAPALDMRIDEIGPVQLEPPVFDGEEMVKPPVMDERHFVNLRFLELEAPSGLAVELPPGIAIINPADISRLYRVWADGMYFAELPTQGG